jgi:hypothetical protein
MLRLLYNKRIAEFRSDAPSRYEIPTLKQNTMRLTLFSLLFILSSVASFSQVSDNNALEKLNAYLTEVYANSNVYYDTMRLNCRKESIELAHSDKPNQKLNGFITLGILDLYAKNTQSSIRYFNQALMTDSNCYPCYIKLHWIYFYLKNNYYEANKQSKLGIMKFEKIVKSDSSFSENWSKLYNMYGLNETRQTEKSRQRMKYVSMKRVALDSNNAYYNWENSFHCDQNKKEFYLRKAYQLHPREDIYWNALANYYCEKKNINQVLEIMNEVKPEEMNDSYWFQQMAVYYFRLGKKKEAKSIYDEAKKLGFEIVYKY